MFFIVIHIVLGKKEILRRIMNIYEKYFIYVENAQMLSLIFFEHGWNGLDRFPCSSEKSVVVFFSVSGEGQSRHADFRFGGLQHSPCARFEGGSGGYYVVDEEYVFSGKGVGFGEGELVADVLPAVETAFLGLCLGEFGADKYVGADGFSKGLGNALGNFLALVVAAFFQFFGVQWHRNKVVDVVETMAFGEGRAQLSAHKNAEFLVALVLDAVQNSLHAAFLGKRQQGGGGLYLHSAPKNLFNGIVLDGRKIGERKPKAAVGTNLIFRA